MLSATGHRCLRGLARREALWAMGMVNGAAVRVAGVVAIRLRPKTARGVMFLTLEDETGVVNIVVMPDVYARERQTLRLASQLATEGIVERGDNVMHILAKRVKAFGHVSKAEAVLSKHFA